MSRGLSALPENESRVYFLASHDGKRIKIGKSHQPRVRMKALRTANPYPLQVVHVVPGYSNVEYELHQMFYEYRLHGEWFEFSAPIASLIGRLQSGTSIRDVMPKSVSRDEEEARVSGPRTEPSNTMDDED